MHAATIGACNDFGEVVYGTDMRMKRADLDLKRKEQAFTLPMAALKS